MTTIPTDIKLHKASKTLTLKYASGEDYQWWIVGSVRGV